MTVKKARDAQDTAILHGLERVSTESQKKWFFVEEILPKYRLAAEVLGVRPLHQSTVSKRLERLADQGSVVVSRRPRSVHWRGMDEERSVKVYRRADLER